MSDTSVQNLAATGRKSLLRPYLLVLPAVLFLLVFFVMPLIDNGMRSIVSESGFTLSRYLSLTTDSFYLGIMAQTVLLSAGVTVISIIIGYPVAYFLVR